MKGLLTAAVLAAAVLVQTAVVNRLPLPWGIVPDVVLLALVAAALRNGRTASAIAGFLCGLAVDLLPPADHELGRYALLYTLVGYLVSRFGDDEGRAPAGHRFAVAAVAAFGTAIAYALLGAALGDPRMGWAVAAFAVPTGALATIVVSPLVLLPVDRLLRAADPDRVDLGPSIRL